mmetsp:Transcript_11742/g.17987  ORF Transcript_11742/g.17987 Transcript_11742/m.17987 type:complete len:154 (+) Transcript_11742:880-1341(+)
MAQEKAKEHLRKSRSPARRSFDKSDITDPVTGPIPDLHNRRSMPKAMKKQRSRSDPRARNGLGISENSAAGVPTLFGKEQDIQAYFPDSNIPEQVFAPVEKKKSPQKRKVPPYAMDEAEDPFVSSPSKEGARFNPRGYAGVPTYPERRAPFDP